MSKLDRKDIKIFAENSPSSISQIGAVRNTGNFNLSTDPDILQALSNYLSGLSEVVFSGTGIPPAEDINAIHYLTTRELAYIQQVGIPEYTVTTTYFANKSIVRSPEGTTLYKSAIDDNLGNDIVGNTAYNAGTSYDTGDRALDTNGDIYVSLTDTNIGNPLTDPINWELTWAFLGNLENLKNLAPASESVAGIAEIATQGETQAGVDDSRIVTPSKLLSLFNPSSKVSNGYIRIPVKVGGVFEEIIIQWGISATATSEINVTTNLPLVFPNAHFRSIIGTSNVGANATHDVWYQLSSTNLSQVVGFRQGAGTGKAVAYTYISIGY